MFGLCRHISKFCEWRKVNIKRVYLLKKIKKKLYLTTFNLIKYVKNTV